MTSHDATPTPGPWFATYHGDKFSDDGPGFWLIDAVPAPNQETAIAEICSKPGDRSEANARLIASAPALAEENARLRAALEQIAATYGKCLLGPEATPDEETAYRNGSAAAFGDCSATARAALAPKEPDHE